ncbi:MAG: sulfotransferase family protein [Stellaceae bacterium]
MIRERAKQGDASPLPVFIVGMPRSGTTLVEQMLASHPEVHGAGELGEIERAVAALGGPDGVPADIGGAELRRLGASYLAKVTALAPGATRITDKMPANFRYAGLIHLALPNARIIHLSRDPVDTCLSCFSILFGGDQPFTYDLGELGRYYRAYQRLMAHWRAVLPAGVMLEVRYEALVGDFEQEARRIVAHCGLRWNAACLDFHNTRRPVHTASSVQVRRPLYRSSVGRWRPAEEVLRPLLDALAEA